MIPTLLTILMLTLNPTDGLAPFETVATVTLDRKVIETGRACLIWINETAPDGLPKSYIDCWDVWPTDTRTKFERPMTFISQGVWVVWSQVTGQNAKGKIQSFITPVEEVVTK